jgi:hypothetical protein
MSSRVTLLISRQPFVTTHAGPYTSPSGTPPWVAAQRMNDRPSAFWPPVGGHQFVEEIVTLCVRAARADKATIEVNVVTDNTEYRAVRRAVEHRIEAVSSIARASRLAVKCKNVAHSSIFPNTRNEQ